jgi:hypothetical protein
MPGWLSGAIPLGGDKYLNLSSLNPYGNVFETPILSPADALRSLNPVIKAAGAAANINVGRGQLMTRPAGTGPLNDLGQPKVGWVGGREFLHYLGQQTPQGRLFKAVREEPVVRYDTGDPVLRSGATIPLPGGRREQILRNVGIPAPQTFMRSEYAARSAKGREAARKAREKRARIFSSR